MTKQQENRAFVKMLKEFPKVFGRVSFRERLMLRTAFAYVAEKIIADLEKENEDLKAKYNRVDVIGYDALRNLTEAKDIIRALLFHITNDTFYVTCETQEQSVERARQFLRGIKVENMTKEKLEKAKELLKEFVQHYKNKTIYVENMQDLLEQSEQFIKDLEK